MCGGGGDIGNWDGNLIDLLITQVKIKTEKKINIWRRGCVCPHMGSALAVS